MTYHFVSLVCHSMSSLGLSPHDTSRSVSSLMSVRLPAPGRAHGQDPVQRVREEGRPGNLVPLEEDVGDEEGESEKDQAVDSGQAPVAVEPGQRVVDGAGQEPRELLGAGHEQLAEHDDDA